jgi:hypothetical protein
MTTNNSGQNLDFISPKPTGLASTIEKIAQFRKKLESLGWEEGFQRTSSKTRLLTIIYFGYTVKIFDFSSKK